ncbi:MAG: glycerophosphodiester phosphodiesterase family protein [Flavobacteriaceae bacterium]
MKYKAPSIVFLFFVFLMQSCGTMNKPLVIGHRGAMGHETENTLASIQKAMDLGVDAMEIDVFKIKSGEIVVFHDNTVDRLTDGSGQIEEYTLSQLNDLTLKGNHKIPELHNVLDVIDAKVILNIELKGANTAAGVHRIVNQYIDEKGWALDDFIISSFKWEELQAIRALNKDIPIAVLTGGDPLEGLEIARELKAEAINPNFKALTSENSRTIKEAGFKIYVWTVNDPQDIIAMKKMAVDGIITNFPERVN